MARKWFLLSLTALLALAAALPWSLALEKVRFATHFKANPHYWLPVAAALDKGFWKEQGLEVDWVPFDAGAAMNRAVAAGAIDMGTAGLADLVRVVSAGVPQVIIADPEILSEFYFWVRQDSPIKEPGDLKGARINVARMGGDAHAYALAAIKALGIEKEVKIVAVGGGPAEMAALRAGSIEATTTSNITMAGLKARGEVREVLRTNDYLPKGLGAQVIYSHKDFLEKKPLLARRMIKGFIQGGEFVMKEREWALEKMKAELRFSDEAAKAVFPLLRYGREGQIDPKKIENTINFLLEYGMLVREKAPKLEDLYAR